MILCCFHLCESKIEHKTIVLAIRKNKLATQTPKKDDLLWISRWKAQNSQWSSVAIHIAIKRIAGPKSVIRLFAATSGRRLSHQLKYCAVITLLKATKDNVCEKKHNGRSVYRNPPREIDVPKNGTRESKELKKEWWLDILDFDADIRYWP